MPPAGTLKVPIAMGVLEGRGGPSRPQWGIDAMLIDEELLYLDEAEADKVYLALKEKSQRRRKQEARENRLSNQMLIDDYYIDEEHFSGRKTKSVNLDSQSVAGRDSTSSSNSSMKRMPKENPRQSQSLEKIRQFIR